MASEREWDSQPDVVADSFEDDRFAIITESGVSESVASQLRSRVWTAIELKSGGAVVRGDPLTWRNTCWPKSAKKVGRVGVSDVMKGTDALSSELIGALESDFFSAWRSEEEYDGVSLTARIVAAIVQRPRSLESAAHACGGDIEVTERREELRSALERANESWLTDGANKCIHFDQHPSDAAKMHAVQGAICLSAKGAQWRCYAQSHAKAQAWARKYPGLCRTDTGCVFVPRGDAMEAEAVTKSIPPLGFVLWDARLAHGFPPNEEEDEPVMWLLISMRPESIAAAWPNAGSTSSSSSRGGRARGFDFTGIAASTSAASSSSAAASTSSSQPPPALAVQRTSDPKKDPSPRQPSLPLSHPSPPQRAYRGLPTENSVVGMAVKTSARLTRRDARLLIQGARRAPRDPSHSRATPPLIHRAHLPPTILPPPPHLPTEHSGKRAAAAPVTSAMTATAHGTIAERTVNSNAPVAIRWNAATPLVASDKNLLPAQEALLHLLCHPDHVIPNERAPSKLVIIARGLSGSGKSTLSASIRRRAAESGAFASSWSVSADHFFYHPAPDASALTLPRGATYAFDIAKLGEAHESCQRQFQCAIDNEVPLIVVDNTNSNSKHYYRTFAKVAKRSGYKTAIVELVCGSEVHARRLHARNEHGAPLKVVMNMFTSWEEVGDTRIVRLLPWLPAVDQSAPPPTAAAAAPPPAAPAIAADPAPLVAAAAAPSRGGGRKKRKRWLPAYMRQAQDQAHVRAPAAAAVAPVSAAAMPAAAPAFSESAPALAAAAAVATTTARAATSKATRRRSTKRTAQRFPTLAVPFGEVCAVKVPQPWASAIVSGARRIENRGAQLDIPPGTNTGTWLAVYASSRTDECARCEEFDVVADPALRAQSERYPQLRTASQLPRSTIVGVMRVSSCVREDQLDTEEEDSDAQVWATGPLCWIIDRTVDFSIHAGALSGAGVDALSVIDPVMREDEDEMWKVLDFDASGGGAAKVELIKRLVAAEDARFAPKRTATAVSSAASAKEKVTKKSKDQVKKTTKKKKKKKKISGQAMLDRLLGGGTETDSDGVDDDGSNSSSSMSSYGNTPAVTAPPPRSRNVVADTTPSDDESQQMSPELFSFSESQQSTSSSSRAVAALPKTKPAAAAASGTVQSNLNPKSKPKPKPKPNAAFGGRSVGAMAFLALGASDSDLDSD